MILYKCNKSKETPLEYSFVPDNYWCLRFKIDQDMELKFRSKHFIKFNSSFPVTYVYVMADVNNSSVVLRYSSESNYKISDMICKVS